MSDKRFRVPLPICGPECLCCGVIPERAIDGAAHSSIGRHRAVRARPKPPGKPASGADEAQP
ncbi:hypothetical protein F3087_15030 [Nocardia colli]|uniref:Uncharacterized protein n=1 Tax=Nocardia colli TaxID=2545717 RepID=A0A5N0EI98_9NOCA|nr:hypothetical protein [Nocardia colli]KAA8888349.1 hypothetical protein F3087_15030 [Nocardia colli]